MLTRDRNFDIPDPHKTSTHEASHAVTVAGVGGEIAWARIGYEYLEEIDGTTAGTCGFYPDNLTPTEIIAIALGGFIGEILILGDTCKPVLGGSDRLLVAKQLARSMPVNAVPEQYVCEQLDAAIEKVVEILADKLDAVERVARALRKHRKLTGDEIKEYINL